MLELLKDICLSKQPCQASIYLDEDGHRDGTALPAMVSREQYEELSPVPSVKQAQKGQNYVTLRFQFEVSMEIFGPYSHTSLYHDHNV